ncbi:opsin-5 isoform X2 [Hemiscyllium ocellatum]|uniref:opsin-5 isoform X2 n=1 Tax=Hemiscyllium ocellatum TaxID=170820 RepID=UPI002966B0F1|nr:opsin-5 isoform X2 [Hemiscyllium ocellatum]
MSSNDNDTVSLTSDLLPSLHKDVFTSKLSWEADIIAGIYLIITGFVSIFGNGYVIYLPIKQKEKLKPAELMTVNLAICDFGMAVGGKPFLISSCFAHRWIFGWIGCRWHGWSGFFFGCGSLITITIVSLDRYLKICYLQYGIWLQRWHVFICLGFVWLYAAFWATIPLVGWGDYAPEPFGTSCTLNWWLAQVSVDGQAFILSILFFCLVLPTAIILFSYVKIIAKVKSSAREVAHFDSRTRSKHLLEMKLTKVAMLICAGFLIAWIPYAVVSVWSAFGTPDSVPVKVSFIPTMFAKSAAMYNPIIYQLLDCRCGLAKLSGCFKSSYSKPSRQKSRMSCTCSETSRVLAPGRQHTILESCSWQQKPLPVSPTTIAHLDLKIRTVSAIGDCNSMEENETKLESLSWTEEIA